MITALVACGGRPTPPAPSPAAPRSSPGEMRPAPVAAPVAPAAVPAPVPTPVADGAITVQVRPAPAYIEIGDHGQLVNCDLVVSNTSTVDWTLSKLQVSVFDRTGALAFRSFINDNGVSPSITTVPNRALGAGQRVLLMNPLYLLPRDLELARLRFELTYERADGDQQLTASAEVNPVVYATRAQLRLPVRGRLIVWDGHDFLSHHRRWDYLFEPIRALGFDSNAARYSYDLIPVDATGAMVHGDEARNESWLGFGKPIHAPAAGTIVAVVDHRPDDRQLDMAAMRSDLMAMFGNYVVLDHGHGEVSVFGHIKQGSAKVKVGARVPAGHELAAIGASGSSLMPHLHYQLQTSATAHAEGLPSYFVDFVRVRGATSIKVKRGQVDTGELLDSAAPRTR